MASKAGRPVPAIEGPVLMIGNAPLINTEALNTNVGTANATNRCPRIGRTSGSKPARATTMKPTRTA